MTRKTVFANLLPIVMMFTLPIMALTSCSDDSDNDELPPTIRTFVSKYWPEIAVESYNFTNNTYKVGLRNSASIIFNTNMSWTSVEGNGVPLPQMFLYDQMPEAVYEYLESTSNVGSVYSVTRNPTIYTIGLLDYTVTYDIATGTVHND